MSAGGLKSALGIVEFMTQIEVEKAGIWIGVGNSGCAPGYAGTDWVNPVVRPCRVKILGERDCETADPAADVKDSVMSL